MLSLVMLAALGQSCASASGQCQAAFARPMAGAIVVYRAESCAVAAPTRVVRYRYRAAYGGPVRGVVRGAGRVVVAPVRLFRGGCR